MTEQSIFRPEPSEQLQQAVLLPPSPSLPQKAIEEIGGFAGPEPTRYGDWEKNGRCIDF
ncbi:MAG TPA: DUF1674 domain-containing protein [Methylomicrobium sp.]|nr:DUF1674 domain-containing protein [Methylomicrobium sp.]